MKVIIPVAGIGSRLRPHTHTQPKSLIPVAGKPILAHIIDYLKNGGIDDFVFVIGYMGDKVARYVQEQYPELNTEFVIQTSGKGTAHAILLALENTNYHGELMVVFGDTIFEADLPAIIKSKNNLVGLKKVGDPRIFGVAELGDEGWIKKLVEKPSIPKSNLAMVGVYKLNNADQLLEALKHVMENNIKSKGEFHLTDALMHMVKNRIKIKGFMVESWFDCGKKDILLETNKLLLKRGEFNTPNPETLPNCVVIPPVYIGNNCKISNSIIGPNVSIGDEVHMEKCIVQNTIIGPHSQLEMANLRASVVGNDASLKGVAYSLNLGDSTEINFGQ